MILYLENRTIIEQAKSNDLLLAIWHYDTRKNSTKKSIKLFKKTL